MPPNPQEIADLVTFTEETFNGKRHFLWGENTYFNSKTTCTIKSKFGLWTNSSRT